MRCRELIVSAGMAVLAWPRPGRAQAQGNLVRPGYLGFGEVIEGRVFEAFARPELLARWWGPSGFTNTFEVSEFRPEGRWRFTMHGPDGSNHPNESEDSVVAARIRHIVEPANEQNLDRL